MARRLALYPPPRRLSRVRELAAGADRDVADFGTELRRHGRVLTALRETQLQHYAEHKADSAELKAGMKAGMTQIVRMLETLGAADA